MENDENVEIVYSEKYADGMFEYRHVILPPETAKLLPPDQLLNEREWRSTGVQQSHGWVHYAIHRPEPHIMLFRRPLNFDHQAARKAFKQASKAQAPAVQGH